MMFVSKNTKIQNFLAFLLGVLCAGNVVQAASFDCINAESDTEIKICDDPGLSKLDEVVGELYTLKSSIDLLGDELSISAAHDVFPDFLKGDTKRDQILWINESQSDCYANTKCLYSIYVDRIGDFFEPGISLSRPSWRIREKEEVLGGDFLVVIWSMDDNEPSNQGCLGVDFTPVYSLITVHDKGTGALIDYNASILPVKENACLMDEIEISSKGENSFEIGVYLMSAAGGWGKSTYKYKFDIVSDEVMLSSYKTIYFQRNVFFFTEIGIDFINGDVTFDYINESEQALERLGRIFEPGEILSEKRSLPNLTSPAFSEINEESLWNIYKDQFTE